MEDFDFQPAFECDVGGEFDDAVIQYFSSVPSPLLHRCSTDTMLCFDERLVVLGSRFAFTHYATFYNASDPCRTGCKLLVRVMNDGKYIRGWNLVNSIPKHHNLLSVSVHEKADSMEQCILMDRCGGDLFDFMWNLNMNKFLSLGVSVELISVVLHMHRFGLAHRDIKPENVLISYDGTIKLSDFDFVTNNRYVPLVHYAGTPRYSPPNIYKKFKKSLKEVDVSQELYDAFEVDKFALCLTIIEILARDETFGREDVPIKYDSKFKDQFRIVKLKFGSQVSERLQRAYLDLTDEAFENLSVELNRKRVQELGLGN